MNEVNVNVRIERVVTETTTVSVPVDLDDVREWAGMGGPPSDSLISEYFEAHRDYPDNVLELVSLSADWRQRDVEYDVRVTR